MKQQLKQIWSFIKDIYVYRSLLFNLAKNDFKARYASSFLGMLWAYIQPVTTIIVIWFVFQVGFKSLPVEDVPFIIWFVPAYLIWSFFSEALTSSTNSLLEYSYLVRKVNFQIRLIPLVKIMSAAIVHVFFLVFILGMMVFYKIPFTVYMLQVFYYFFCTFVFLVGLGWLLSAIAVFARDISNIVSVIIQVGFWATPIFWDPSTMSPKVQMILKLNPMYYICRGYRDCFVSQVWFWERGFTNLYFWVVMLGTLALGIYVFNKLKPHFTDML